MRAGTRKLLALTIPSPLRQYQGSKLGNAAQLVLIEAPHASRRGRCSRTPRRAAIATLMDRAGGPVYDEASFEQVCATTSPATPGTRPRGSSPTW